MTRRPITTALTALAVLASTADGAAAADRPAPTANAAAVTAKRVVSVRPAARTSRALTFHVDAATLRTATGATLRLGRRSLVVPQRTVRAGAKRGRVVVAVKTKPSERRVAQLAVTVPVSRGTKKPPVKTTPPTTTTTTPTTTTPAPAPEPTPAPAPAPAPTPAPTTGPAPIGIHANLRWRSGTDLTNTVNQLADAGFTMDREDFSWNRIEAVPGTYDWSYADRMIGAAAKRGIRIMAVLDDAPTWATSAWNFAPLAGTAKTAFTAFVRAAVARYGTTGTFWNANPSLPKVPVLQWDVWNEPYLTSSWTNSALPDPIAYGTLFRDTVLAARSADPNAQFLLEADTGIRETAYPYKPWLAAALDGVPGLAATVDAISVHDYSNDPGRCTPYSPSKGVDGDYVATIFQFCKLLDARRILDARGLTATKIWVTETGASTAPQNQYGVTEAQQAQIVHDVFTQLRQYGVVAGVVWYDLTDQAGAAPTDKEGFFGLRRADGTAKPAWSALLSEMQTGLPAV